MSRQNRPVDCDRWTLHNEKTKQTIEIRKHKNGKYQSLRYSDHYGGEHWDDLPFDEETILKNIKLYGIDDDGKTA